MGDQVSLVLQWLIAVGTLVSAAWAVKHWT